jgi:rRNA processing protein Krr1/Pno1
MMEKLDTATRAITGQFTLSAQLLSGKNISVVGYLYDGEALASVNERVDMLMDVIDRQRTRSEIPELEAQIEKQNQQIEQMLPVYETLAHKATGAGRLAGTEKQTLTQLESNIKMHRDNIARGEAAIVAAKAKL